MASTAWGVPQGATIAPFGFTGELQGGAGLTYLRARWYNAASGRFGSRDPFAGFAEQPYSLHSYQYGYSNPVLYTDPSGELAIFFQGGWDTPEDRNDITRMKESFAAMIPGESLVLRADDLDLAIRKIKEVDENKFFECTSEPIILIGYSRGGATVQYAITSLRGGLGVYGDVPVDLAVTIGPVPFNHPTSKYFSTHKSNDVREHLNILSGQANAALPPGKPDGYPSNIPNLPEREISGATNLQVPGTSHFSVVSEKMIVYDSRPATYYDYNRKLGPEESIANGRLYTISMRMQPSPVWVMIQNAIRVAVNRSDSTRIP